MSTNENQEILTLTSEIKAFKEHFNKRGGAKHHNLEKNAWKKMKPNPEEVQVKQVNGKTFIWCVNYKAWCMHKPIECRLGTPTANAQTSRQVDEMTKDSDKLLRVHYKLGACHLQRSDSCLL